MTILLTFEPQLRKETTLNDYQLAAQRRANGEKLGVADVRAILAHQAAERAKRSGQLANACAETEPAKIKPMQTAKANVQQAPQADVAKAVAAAITSERARIATVFAAPAAHGRERVCATLLADRRGWSADAIVAELASLPKDADLASRASAKVNAKASAVWDKAIARNVGKEA